MIFDPRVYTNTKPFTKHGACAWGGATELHGACEGILVARILSLLSRHWPSKWKQRNGNQERKKRRVEASFLGVFLGFCWGVFWVFFWVLWCDMSDVCLDAERRGGCG